VGENTFDDEGFVDQGDEAAAATAVGTAQGIDVVDASQ
jgi:hypothetical protein